MVSDLAKQVSDDSILVNEHIAFLLNKYRSYLLKQKYNNKAVEPSLSNYQTICVNLKEVPDLTQSCIYNKCADGGDAELLRSTAKLSLPLSYGETKISLFRCPGEYSLTLNLANVKLTDEQAKYLNELINVFSLYDKDGGWDLIEEGSNIYQHEEDYVELSTSDEHWILINYDTEKHLYTFNEDIDLFWAFYGSDTPIYQTNCSEDVQTVINLLERQGIPATLVKVSTGEQACNADTFYGEALKRFDNISFVNRDRFNYVGYNKYNKRSVYGTIGVDNYLYIKSSQDLSLFDKALLTGIFEDPLKAMEQSSCTYDDGQGGVTKCPQGDTEHCDPWDNEFPIEDALQTQLINLVLKDILGAAYRPKDPENNASDDLSSIQNFIANNMKERYNKQQEA